MANDIKLKPIQNSAAKPIDRLDVQDLPRFELPGCIISIEAIQPAKPQRLKTHRFIDRGTQKYVDQAASAELGSFKVRDLDETMSRKFVEFLVGLPDSQPFWIGGQNRYVVGVLSGKPQQSRQKSGSWTICFDALAEEDV